MRGKSYVDPDAYDAMFRFNEARALCAGSRTAHAEAS